MLFVAVFARQKKELERVIVSDVGKNETPSFKNSRGWKGEKKEKALRRVSAAQWVTLVANQ